jgi:hypothetical protein
MPTMRRSLRLHPDSRCIAPAHVEVVVGCPFPDSLHLSYIVTGKLNEVRMPPVVVTSRSDQLWRHTCFEAFVRASAGASYYEFNFAPSTQWAAYRFSGYRTGMRVASEIGAPAIDVNSNDDCYTLQVALALGRLTELPRNAPWRLGLSALIEDTSGCKSYWALAHPPGKPDFHHADCFAYEYSQS